MGGHVERDLIYCCVKTKLQCYVVHKESEDLFEDVNKEQ